MQLLECFKHLGLFDLPMTNIGSLSPFIFAAAKPVSLILLPMLDSSAFLIFEMESIFVGIIDFSFRIVT